MLGGDDHAGRDAYETPYPMLSSYHPSSSVYHHHQHGSQQIMSEDQLGVYPEPYVTDATYDSVCNKRFCLLSLFYCLSNLFLS